MDKIFEWNIFLSQDVPRFATEEYDYYIHGFKPMSDRPMQHKRTHIEYGYTNNDADVGHPTYRRVRSRSLPDVHVSRGENLVGIFHFNKHFR